MTEMPDNLRKIERMSWDALRRMAAKELSTIPEEKQLAFEKMFGQRWPQFQQMILSLVEKSYDEISPVREGMAMLGDLSNREVTELALVSTINSRLKSSKVAFWEVCRFLHTKAR